MNRAAFPCNNTNLSLSASRKWTNEVAKRHTPLPRHLQNTGISWCIPYLVHSTEQKRQDEIKRRWMLREKYPMALEVKDTASVFQGSDESWVGEKTNEHLQEESIVQIVLRETGGTASCLELSEHKEGFKPFKLPPCNACAKALQTHSIIGSLPLYGPGLSLLCASSLVLIALPILLTRLLSSGYYDSNRTLFKSLFNKK